MDNVPIIVQGPNTITGSKGLHKALLALLVCFLVMQYETPISLKCFMIHHSFVYGLLHHSFFSSFLSISCLLTCFQTMTIKELKGD